jgi:hypothetical protein
MALMDDVERQRFLDTLRSDAQFRAQVRRTLLAKEPLILPEAVADIVARPSQDFTRWR